MKNIFYDQIIEGIGWAVVHSFWQGLIIVALVSLSQLLFGQKDPAIKFRLAFGGLLLLFISAVVTFFLSIPETGLLTANLDKSSETFFMIEDTTNVSAAGFSLVNMLENNVDFIAAIWLVGFGLLFFRMVLAYMHISHLRRNGTEIVDDTINRLISSIRKRISFKQNFDVKWSSISSSPMVIGILKPCVLLPVALINRIDPEDLELIIAHELAHLKRLDHFSLFLQQLIEAFLYFNPFVWILSRQLNRFREEACDDLVVQTYGSNINYAKSLVRIQEIVMNEQQLSLSLNATGNKNRLLNRISRILNIENKKQFNMGRILIIALLPLALILASFYQGTTENPSTIDVQEESLGLMNVQADLFIMTDSIPKKKKKVIEKVIKKENDKSYEIEYENDELKSLKVDGKEIPKSEYGEYDEVISGLKKEIDQADMNEDRVIRKKLKIKRDGDEEEDVIIMDGDDLEFDFDFNWTEDLEKELDVMDVFKDSMIIMKFKGLDDDDIKIHKFKHYDFDSDHFNDAMKNFQFQFEDGGEIREKLNEAMKSLQLFREEGAQEDIDRAMKQLEKALENLPEKMELNKHLFFMPGDDGKHLFEEYHNEEWNEELERNMRDREKEIEKSMKEYEKVLEREMKLQEKHLEKMFKDKEHKGIHVFPDMEGNFHKPMIIRKHGFHNVQDRIEHELKKDGFIQEGENYSLLLKSGKLKINGKKQPLGVYERYRDLYEDHTGVDLDSGSILKLNNK